jgi:hypothetical protein
MEESHSVSDKNTEINSAQARKIDKKKALWKSAFFHDKYQ